MAAGILRDYVVGVARFTSTRMHYDADCLGSSSINDFKRETLRTSCPAYVYLPVYRGSIRSPIAEMASTSDNRISSLTEQLKSPPKASIQILGTHMTNDQCKAIDFDLWIDCTEVVGIRSGQLVTTNASGCRAWEKSTDQDGSIFEEIVTGWLRESPTGTRYAHLAQSYISSKTNPQLGSSWTLHKSAFFPDGSSTAFKSHIERLARSIAYGGSVEVVFHRTSAEPDAMPEQHDVQIRAEWSFECPFTAADHIWNQAVMNAMVDRKKDRVSPSQDLRPAHGMSSFRTAIRQGGMSRVVLREQDAMG